MLKIILYFVKKIWLLFAMFFFIKTRDRNVHPCQYVELQVTGIIRLSSVDYVQTYVFKIWKWVSADTDIQLYMIRRLGKLIIKFGSQRIYNLQYMPDKYGLDGHISAEFLANFNCLLILDICYSYFLII